MLIIFRYLKPLLCLIVFRVIILFLVQSYFVPDEYWQSLEIAHNTVFGYGYITWEWKEAIRSFFYPSLFSLAYKLLELLKIDYVLLLIFIPRLMQALLSAVADLYFWLWLKIMLKKPGVDNNQLYWTFFMWLMCLFVNYCSTRTLTNTAELNFSTIALYYYPWTLKPANIHKCRNNFLWFIGLACLVRPTAAIQWLPLCVFNILTNPKPIKHLFNVYFVYISKIFCLSVMIDVLFYKKFVLTPLNFILYNGRYNVGIHYGTHTWFWYITGGIPVVLGPIFILFYFVSLKIMKFLSLILYKMYSKCDVIFDHLYNYNELILFFTVVWSIFWYSLVPHKEFRFILPLAPIMFYLSGISIHVNHNYFQFKNLQKSNFIILGITISSVLVNIIGLVYLGMWHQVGQLNVISKLAQIANDNPNKSNFLFLTSCHATPLYSHLHINVPTRFLTCEPNLNNEPFYKDESDIFFENPLRWLNDNYLKKDICSMPSHIIFYSSLKPLIESFLNDLEYEHLDSVFNSHILQGRQSGFIEIFHLFKPVDCVV